MKLVTFTRATVVASLALGGLTAQAADWNDTYIGYRVGTDYAEPFNSNAIRKNIFNLSHASGYKYGSNFLNVDMLISDDKDTVAGGKEGAQEIYVVYRHTLDLGKATGKEFNFGPVRGMGVTAGFDFNTKNNGYASKKQMLVAGPTFMMDVPGFLNVSLLLLNESNAPGSTARYTYDTHPMLDLSWGIPFNVGSMPLSFEGFANFIAAKGKNESNTDTAPETNIDMRLMYDLSSTIGASPKTFRVGVEYQYWKNKFGNNSDNIKGAIARTPMIRAEYHF